MIHGSRCYLQSKAPSHTFDLKSDYHADNDTKLMLSMLPLSSGKSLSTDVITSAAMGYR